MRTRLTLLILFVFGLLVISQLRASPDLLAQSGGAYVLTLSTTTAGGTAVAGQMRWLFPFPALATWHKATALESAYRLRDLNPTRLAVGHGRVLENPQAVIDAAIREAEKSLKVFVASS